MDMGIIKAILAFAGGLGLFVYGMDVMADGLQQAAGDKTRKLLEALTKNRLMGVIAGALVTAIIQSSSAVTVMVVGFVNASLLNLSQAVGVIMGANIGTTMTAWIVSMGEWASFLKPDMIAPGLLLVGVAMNMFARSGRMKDASKILIGFGMLFTGLSSMSSAVKPYTDAPIFSQAFTVMGSNPILGILAGALVTAVIQSSSASMGILQTLAAAGAVNWGSAVFIALGQNIGTCVTAMISAVSADTNAKRAAVIHLEFNTIGAVIAGIAAYLFFLANPSLTHAHVNSTSLAIFHTGFNLAITAILFPFANQLVALSKKIVPDHKKNRKEEMLQVLDPRFLQMPQVALNAVSKEEQMLTSVCVEMIGQTRDAVLENADVEQLTKNAQTVQRTCIKVKKYLSKIEPDAIRRPEQNRIQKYLLAARDLHQISAYCVEINRLNQEMMEVKNLNEYTRENINTLSSLCERALSHAMNHGNAQENNYSTESAIKSCEMVYDIEKSVSEHFESAESNSAEQVFLMEVCDCYKSIANRCLRLIDENQWKQRIERPVPRLADFA